MIKKFTFLFASIFSVICANAQTTTELKLKPKKIDITSGMESSILQFAKFVNNGKTEKTIPRYSYYFNSGIDINLKINKTVYPFTGVYIKNIGMIDKYGDSLKFKRRMYSIGAPLGLKIKAGKEVQFKLGADFNLVFNYKEKMFVNGDKKSKYNEFFSKRTPMFYPSFFAGFSISGISLSANYYPNNFFNTNYEHTTNYFPFKNYEAKLFTISAGFDISSKSLKKGLEKSLAENTK